MIERQPGEYRSEEEAEAARTFEGQEQETSVEQEKRKPF